MHLGLRESARLALEGNFLGGVPGNVCAQPINQPLELPRAQERWRAAAEVHESKRTVAHHGQLADELDLLRERGEIPLDFVRVFIRKNFEVAELAPLAAERYVQV